LGRLRTIRFLRDAAEIFLQQKPPYPCRRQCWRLACSSSHEAKSTPMKMVPGWKVLPTVT